MKMTKSRVESNVHLLTANTPSTRVQCHRMPNSSHSSLTNTFLKKGGALPSVLPVDDCIVESPCKPKHPSLTRKRNSLIIKKGNREDSERQPPHYVSHYGSLLSLVYHIQSCLLLYLAWHSCFFSRPVSSRKKLSTWATSCQKCKTFLKAI